MRIGHFIVAAALAGTVPSAGDARSRAALNTTVQGPTLGQCLAGQGVIDEAALDGARGAAKSLMDDYWLLALVSDTADVTPAFQSVGTTKWVDGLAELSGAQLKRLRDPLARNAELTMSSQPLSFALSGAGGNDHARGVWSVYPRSDPSRIAGYYAVDFTKVANVWGISQVALVHAPAEAPAARPFCVQPGDVEVAASVRSESYAATPDVRPARLPSAAPIAPAAAAPVADSQEYRIARGDKIKITTFGEDRFSGEFLVHADGRITFPLFGDIPAAGLTTGQLTQGLENRLAPDYLREPQVTAEVVSFRPVYVLGEVARPGQYAYAEGMTMFALIAQAGGFSYRANHKRAFIRHDGNAAEQRVDIESATAVLPGDTIRIPQRIF